MYQKGSLIFEAFVGRDMERLMGRIADQIADKVQEQLWKSRKVGRDLWLLWGCLLFKEQININQILSLDPPKAFDLQVIYQVFWTAECRHSKAMQIIEDGKNALVMLCLT